MRIIHNKQYTIEGIIGNASTFEVCKANIITNLTNDGKLCTLSVAIEDTDLQITIPINAILNDLNIR